jgi:hypothetical protein
MIDPITHDYFEQQQDRQELAEAVSSLGSFIGRHSLLNDLEAERLALAILTDGPGSGVVSAARAVRLLKEAVANT